MISCQDLDVMTVTKQERDYHIEWDRDLRAVSISYAPHVRRS